MYMYLSTCLTATYMYMYMYLLQVLKKQEYFGKFGKIFKVVINNHTVYSGQQVIILTVSSCKHLLIENMFL